MESRTRPTANANAPLAARLAAAGVKPTAQRMQIAAVLLDKPQHLSADAVLERARKHGRVSKATVYNTLKLFAERGLIRTVVVDPDRVFFDSETHPHHHLFCEDTRNLVDIPLSDLQVSGLPPMPDYAEVVSVEVVVRVRTKR